MHLNKILLQRRLSQNELHLRLQNWRCVDISAFCHDNSNVFSVLQVLIMSIDDTHDNLASNFEFVKKFADSSWEALLSKFEFALFEAVNKHK